jgi:hypothetical protein
MALFEQRFSDEQVRAARQKIAAGASLRSVATEIGCAPSTLSVRIKKIEAAEAAVLARVGLIDDGQRLPQGSNSPHALLAITGRKGASSGEMGPLEVLRGAMEATKVNGQPDWPTRLAAARAFAALFPNEVKPMTEEVPSIAVYDLPPGTHPVLHRPRGPQVETPKIDAETPSEPPQVSVVYMFSYKPEAGESELIGTWSPDLRGQPGGVNVVFPATEDAETAERWRTDLAAGRLPDPR